MRLPKKGEAGCRRSQSARLPEAGQETRARARFGPVKQHAAAVLRYVWSFVEVMEAGQTVLDGVAVRFVFSARMRNARSVQLNE